MSRVLPTLFNTDMVRAILDGRKTVTRRVIKPQPTYSPNSGFSWKGYAYGTDLPQTQSGAANNFRCAAPCQPGDILYVRETWCWCPCWDCGMDTEEHNCCYKAEKFFNHDKGEWGCYGYKASFEDNEYPSVDTWHPSIHMPKEAARIWLKVTDVRVERLQEITSKDAVNEGVGDLFYKEIAWDKKNYGTEVDLEHGIAREQFAWLWDSTIKKSDLDRYGWDANPWVFVIEFERCKKPENA